MDTLCFPKPHYLGDRFPGNLLAEAFYTLSHPVFGKETLGNEHRYFNNCYSAMVQNLWTTATIYF